MRREGQQHGWVCAYEHTLVDPKGKRRVVGVVAAPVTVANSGFVRALRKPTNHSKFTGGRAFRDLRGKGDGWVSSMSSKGRHKFKHNELKAYHLELEGGADDAVDGHMYL